MRRTRRNPPPQRTHEDREAARAERERRRAARRGEPAADERRSESAAENRREERTATERRQEPADQRRHEPDATERGAVHDWSRAEPLPGDPILPAPVTAAARGAIRERGPSGRARNTVIFSVLTGFSRVAGLAREIVARSYFGTSGAMSAFTLAFQVPNLVRALVADAALSSAFVPVFSELLEKQRRREALQLASALAGLLLVALGTLTLAFIAIAPVLMPLFTGDQSTPALDDLTVGLSQVLFPIVVLLGLNGLVVGILNAHEHFTIPALAPLVWNAVIIAGLVCVTPLFEGDDQLYAYAIGVLAGTIVQLAMCLPQLRRTGYPLRFSFAFRHDPRVRRVLLLMLPVSLGIGLINVSLLINSAIGFLVSEEAPTAIDAAFRIYMLPQGMFSVAVTTVLFPALSRLAARRDLAAAVRPDAASDAQLLLAPASMAADAAGDLVARGQRGGRAGALQAVRNRRHRDRHGGLEPRADAARGAPPAPGAGRAGGGAHAQGHGRDRARRGAARRGRVRRVVRPRLAARALAGRAADRGRLRARARRARLRRGAAAQRAARGAPDRRPVRAQAEKHPLVTSYGRHGRPVPHPQLLDHRPHRPWEVDAGRSHPRDDAHRADARDARAAARLDGPRARARDHDQGAGGARLLHRARRRDLPVPPDRHPGARRLHVRGVAQPRGM